MDETGTMGGAAGAEGVNEGAGQVEGAAGGDGTGQVEGAAGGDGTGQVEGAGHSEGTVTAETVYMSGLSGLMVAPGVVAISGQVEAQAKTAGIINEASASPWTQAAVVEALWSLHDWLCGLEAARAGCADCGATQGAALGG